MPTDGAVPRVLPSPYLSTFHLSLRPFAPEDADELHALFADPRVRRYLLDDQVMPRDWVAEEIEASEVRFDTSGMGLWAARELGEDTIVGFIGFRPFFEPPELQLLYGFLPAYWGRGLATEAGREVLRHGFEVLGLRRVRAATDTPNVASMKVLERLGMEEVERTADGVAGTVFFELDHSAWTALSGLHRPVEPRR